MNKKKILIVEDEFIIADVLDGILRSAGYEVCGIADSVKEALEMVIRFKPEFVLLDIYLKGKQTGIDLAHQLTERDIPFLYISANSNQKVLDAAKSTHPYGFVIKPFRDRDVLTALDIAFYRYDNQRETGSQQTALLQKKAAEILVSTLSWEHRLLEMAKSLQPHFPFEFFSFGIKQEEHQPFYELAFSRVGYDEYQLIGANELMMITNHKQNELICLKLNDQAGAIATWYDDNELAGLLKGSSLKKLYAETYHLHSHLTLPVEIGEGKYAYLNFYSRRPDAYQADHLLLANRLQPVLDNFTWKMLQQASSPLAVERSNFTAKHPAPAAEQPNPFQGIIGKSHLLLTVFDHVIQVAKADSSVLILGESGTGKEKIAERIHSLSLRKDKPFIRINCAALPTSLIDSELFGHEKGAFTGAYERKIGKFEQAHTGSIFLDEIGELPLESQSKLLRVLQEKEIERIGGRVTIKTDVRIIAATNRDLSKEVAEGRFRLDLFYRINVSEHLFP
jgi:DNA-binding NtrC family response regulator